MGWRLVIMSEEIQGKYGLWNSIDKRIECIRRREDGQGLWKHLLEGGDKAGLSSENKGVLEGIEWKGKADCGLGMNSVDYMMLGMGEIWAESREWNTRRPSKSKDPHPRSTTPRTHTSTSPGQYYPMTFGKESPPTPPFPSQDRSYIRPRSPTPLEGIPVHIIHSILSPPIPIRELSPDYTPEISNILTLSQIDINPSLGPLYPQTIGFSSLNPTYPN